MSRDGVIFRYDYENRLVSAGSVGYAYDADGIRVSSVSAGSATDYVVDRNRQYAQVLEEKNAAGSVSYVHGDDLISRKQGGEVRYYVYDGHGSVRQLTDADGAVTDSYIYDAFGNLRDHLGDSDNRYLYAGEQYDPASGLYYLRARYYGPANGRFLTHDPYPGRLNEPVSLHKYLYGNANPVSYVDPGGEFSSLISTLEAMAVANIVTAIGIQGFVWNNLGKEPVRWFGDLRVVTLGRTFSYLPSMSGFTNLGAGIIWAELCSNIDGERICEDYIVIMGGLTISPPKIPVPLVGDIPLPPFAFSVGLAEIEAPRLPSLDGNHSEDLSGLSTWISLTSAPPGVSYTNISMGRGIGMITPPYPDAVVGFDIGLDIMIGYSVRLSRD